MNTSEILTRQEERVARSIVKGNITKEVASELNVSENTVKNHVQNIYDKTEIPRCLNALVSWWYQTNFSIDIKKVITIVFLLIYTPNDITLFTRNNRRSRSSRIAERRHSRRSRDEQEQYPNLLDFA